MKNSTRYVLLECFSITEFSFNPKLSGTTTQYNKNRMKQNNPSYSFDKILIELHGSHVGNNVIVKNEYLKTALKNSIEERRFSVLCVETTRIF